MRTRPLLIALFGVALVVGACSSGNSTPAPASGAASTGASPAPASAGSTTGSPATTTTSSAGATSGATASGGQSAGASATAGGSGSAAPTTAGSCTPEAPTAASANWTTLQAHDGDFTFKYPGNWDKIYGAFVFNTASLLDPQTFAETGLPATSETRADLVRAPGVGLPNASILIVPGVTSDTGTVFQRQLARFGAIPDIKVVANNLTACIGGEPAMGVAFTFNKDTTYQESWYLVKNGRSYDFQWLAPKGQEATDTFREMFRTLQWTPNVPVATPLPIPSGGVPSAAPSGSANASQGSSFVTAGMTTKIDTAATAANPKDYVTTIPKESTSIYSVFALKPGLTGQVNGALKQGDKVLVTLSLQYGPKNTWGDFRINSANGITPGDYTMVMTYVPTGETINLPFTVK